MGMSVSDFLIFFSKHPEQSWECVYDNHKLVGLSTKIADYFVVFNKIGRVYNYHVDDNGTIIRSDNSFLSLEDAFQDAPI